MVFFHPSVFFIQLRKRWNPHHQCCEIFCIKGTLVGCGVTFQVMVKLSIPPDEIIAKFLLRRTGALSVVSLLDLYYTVTFSSWVRPKPWAPNITSPWVSKVERKRLFIILKFLYIIFFSLLQEGKKKLNIGTDSSCKWESHWSNVERMLHLPRQSPLPAQLVSLLVH